MTSRNSESDRGPTVAPHLAAEGTRKDTSPGPKNSIAFVAGATGYVGNALVQCLLSKGIDTIAHIRKQSKLYDTAVSHFTDLGARIDTTPWDHKKMEFALGDLQPTLIFSTLGTTRARRRKAATVLKERETYLGIDYGLNKMLLDVILSLKLDTKFVYLSALGASSSAWGSYMRVRGTLEEEIAASGVSYVILRPGFISGRDRRESRPLERMTAGLSDTVMRGLGHLGMSHLDNRYRSFSAEECASALVKIGFDPQFEGTIVFPEHIRANLTHFPHQNDS